MRLRRHPLRGRRSRCETLEDRRLLAQFVVTSLADAGPGTLREAIDLANATTEQDEIRFDAALFATGSQTIALAEPLPTLVADAGLIGPGHASLTIDAAAVRDPGNEKAGVLEIGAGVQAVLSGFSVEGAPSSALVSHGQLTVSAMRFERNGNDDDRNNQDASGGAIESYGDLVVVESRFLANTAAYGGAILAAGPVHIVSSAFEANVAFSGGGLLTVQGDVNVESSTFWDNEATEGGAIHVGPGGTALTASTLSANRGHRGAAIFSDDGVIAATFTTINDNVATDGYALEGTRDSTFALDHTVVAGTRDADGTPVFDLASATGSNNFVGMARGSSPLYPGFSGDSGLVDGVDGNQVGSITLITTGVTTGAPIYPRLGPLADNGGPTLTHAPLAGSPLIDAGALALAGDPPPNDQRGYARFADGGSGSARADVGAYEAQGPVTTLAGDFNGDGHVNAADYTVWRDADGQTRSPLTGADATGDGLVDAADHATWLSLYGFQYHVGPTIVVNDLGDADDGDPFNETTTLREAIAIVDANPTLDTITFDAALSGGVIRVGSTFTDVEIWADLGQLTVRSDLTIDASMLAEGITLDGEHRTRILSVRQEPRSGLDYPLGGPDLTLRGLHLRDARSLHGTGASIQSRSRGEVTLFDTTITDSVSECAQGGAIYALGPVTLVDSRIVGAASETLEESTSRPSGGAIYAEGDVTLTRSQIVGSRAPEGGGVIAVEHPTLVSLEPYPFEAPGWITVTLTDSEVIDSLDGGAIVANGRVVLERSRVDNNVGGGVRSTWSEGPEGVELPPDVVVIDSSVSDNAGFGVYAAGAVALDQARIERNTPGATPWTAPGGGVNAASVTAVDSFIDDNTAETGAGIYATAEARDGFGVVNGTVVHLVGTSVSGNTGEAGGAAIHSLGGVLIEGSYLDANHADDDGLWSSNEVDGIVIVDRSDTSHGLRIVDTTLSNNTGSPNAFLAAAGALHQTPSAELERVTITGNTLDGPVVRSIVDSTIAGNTGTGAWVSELVQGSVIEGNQAGGIRARDGGGSSSGRVLRLIDTEVVRNTTSARNADGVVRPYTAGIRSDGTVYLERTLVAENTATVYDRAWNVTTSGGVTGQYIAVVDSTIRDNVVIDERDEGAASPTNGLRGAGINQRGTLWLGPITPPSVLLLRSTVSGNTVIGDYAEGAGVHGATVELVQSTISGNSAIGSSSRGGGVSGASVTATHTTITDNAAESSGGLFASNAITLDGSIVAANRADTRPDLGGEDHFGVSAALTIDHSLVGDTSGSGIVRTTGIGNVLDADPRLGPLALNGGTTATHTLLPGSPAIDAGDPTRTAVPRDYGFGERVFDPPTQTDPGTTDQRGDGYARSADGGSGPTSSGNPRIDIGAYEAQAPVVAMPGDFNGDGLVNAADYTVWRDNVGGSPAPLAGADATGDGAVDYHDHASWAGHYGHAGMTPASTAFATSGASSPSSALLSAIAGADTAYDPATPQEHSTLPARNAALLLMTLDAGTRDVATQDDRDTADRAADDSATGPADADRRAVAALETALATL